jgi:hypothetical protein
MIHTAMDSDGGSFKLIQVALFIVTALCLFVLKLNKNIETN